MEISSLIYPVVSLGGMGLGFGLVLAYASKKFEVEVDPKIPAVRDALPGANCGGCGYAGCDAFAEAVVNGEAAPSLCGIGGASCVENIGNILGIEVEASAPMVAFVKCNGTCDKAKEKSHYYGVQDCRQASIVPGGGSKSCEYGCTGLGSCVRACNFDAINIVDGIAVVDESKCVSCGACITACPKDLIHLVPAKSLVRIHCNSKNKGKEVKDACEVGCIGCTLCVKSCNKDAMHMENNLPIINYDNCVNCGLCAMKCPTKAILNLRVKKKPQPASDKEVNTSSSSN